MYLLYLDESGAHSQARHFVLAGVAIYEASVYWADNELNRLQAQYFPGIAESVLFHATPLRAGERDSVPYPFNLLDRDTRFKLLDELYEVVQAVHGTFFAVVVEKSSLTANENPYELALEQILSRFDHFLRRMYLERNQRDKGLVVIADSSYRERLEGVARQFAAEGTRWHNLNNIVAIPFFTLSKNSRLLQIADLIANTVYGRYESGYASRFDSILSKFDQDDRNRMHGLVHLCRDRETCYLPCCLTRRM